MVGISSGQILLPVLFYSVICAGGIYSAANTSATKSELARQIKQGQANLVVCSEDTKDVAVEAAKECGVLPERVLVLKSDPRSLRSIDGLVNCISDHELDWTRVTDPQELENSVICLLYSSGTTGVPKGVLLSHTNVVSEALVPQFQIREYLERQKKLDPNTQQFEYRTLAHLPGTYLSQHAMMFRPDQSLSFLWLPSLASSDISVTRGADSFSCSHCWLSRLLRQSSSCGWPRILDEEIRLRQVSRIQQEVSDNVLLHGAADLRPHRQKSVGD